MKNVFEIGDTKVFEKVVDSTETAQFNGAEVHPFYSTYALTRDAEWSSRLFVLEMKDEGEEGIGTFVNIEHVSPALVGQTVRFTATITELERNAVNCSIEACVGDRVIATGSTGQKIVSKDKLDQLENDGPLPDLVTSGESHLVPSRSDSDIQIQPPQEEQDDYYYDEAEDPVQLDPIRSKVSKETLDSSFDPEKAVHFFAARDSLPTKIASLHQCTDVLYLKRFIPKSFKKNGRLQYMNLTIFNEQINMMFLI